MTDAATTTRGRTAPTAGEPSPAQKVQQSAARAAEGVAGVHELGTPGGRALVRAMGRVPGGRTTYGPGVSVEVGERKAAVDVSLVVEYGSPAPAVAGQVREAVREQVQRDAGLEVVEVNVTVVGLHHPDDDIPPEPVDDPVDPAEPADAAEEAVPADPDASTAEVREAGEEVQRIVAEAVDGVAPGADDSPADRRDTPTVVVDAGSDGSGPDVVVADQVVLADSVVVVDQHDQQDQQDQHEGDRPAQDDQAPPRHG